MNTLLQDIKRKKLIENWKWYEKSEEYIIHNNIKLYPFVYHETNKDYIIYVTETGVAYLKDINRVLYMFENMFIENPHLQ